MWCCVAYWWLMRHTKHQYADQGFTGTQSQALRLKHYWSEVKCSAASWDLNPEPSHNSQAATGKKCYTLVFKALFYCFWVDKLQIYYVVCGHVISVWILLLSPFSLPRFYCCGGNDETHAVFGLTPFITKQIVICGHETTCYWD